MKSKMNLLLYQHNIHRLFSLVKKSKYKIISFDIFDTLLVRPVIDPKDLFMLVNEKSKTEYHLDFNTLRSKAEELVESQYANIYNIWEAVSEKHKLSDEQKEALINLEIECESQMLYPRQVIKRLYELAIENNKKIIAVSDMYLPKDILREILNKNGYEISDIYVSCDFGCRKDDEGALFDCVIKNERVEPKSILHIGDSFKSDYYFAKKKGITAFYIPSNIKLINALYNFDFCQMEDPICRVIFGYAINSIFEDYTNKRLFVMDYKKLSTIMLFPLITTIAFYCANNSDIKNSYKTVYFISRDGYLPSKAFEMLKNRMPGIIEGQYIYGSRVAYSCLFEDSFFDGYEVLETNEISCTLNDYIEMTIVDDYYRNSIRYRKSQTVLDTILVDKTQVKELLEDDIDELEKYFKSKQDACKLYYQNLMFDENSRVVVFDCGYSGSVSTGISQALNHSKYVDKIYLYETLKNADCDKINNTKTFTLIDDKLNGKMDLFLELMLSSGEGSCIGFKKIENNGIPVLSMASSRDNRQIIDEMQSETVFVFSRFIELLGPYCKWINPTRCSMYSDLFEKIIIKRKDTISLISKIVFADEFYGGKKINLASFILSGRKEWKIYQLFLKFKDKGIKESISFFWCKIFGCLINLVSQIKGM